MNPSIPRLQAPAPRDLALFLEREARAELSYPEQGATGGELPPGYDHDVNRIRLGSGERDYEVARAALRAWRPFPSWVRVVHRGEGPTPLEPGRVVVLDAQAFGLHWLSATRIVYVVDEGGPHARLGFAYGTLPGHVERGEERFLVERLPDDSVWYDLRSFSKPRHALVRLARPLARRLQQRFIRDSLGAMKVAVELGR